MDPIVPLTCAWIEKFRGIRWMKIDLHPRVTVLFGNNASGKTTVLDALAIGFGVLVSRMPHAQGRGFSKTGDIRVPVVDRPDDHERRGVPCKAAEVILDGQSGHRWAAVHWRSAADRRARAKHLTRGKTVFEAVDVLVRETLDATPGALTTPLPLFAAYGTERAVVEVPLRERDFQTEFSRLAAYDKSLVATTRFKTVFEWFRVQEDQERREREKRRDFDYLLPELEWIRRAVADAGLRCSNPRVETRPVRMLVDFEHGDGVPSEELDIQSLSDGFRTHFALVVDIARRMVQLNPSEDLNDPRRGTRSPAVILIDEIDLHLDPPWQARVVQGLQQAFPNAQFVLTTHSEQVLGSVPAECVRRLSWREGEVVVESVPFAQGATGERILVELMGAQERVPGEVTDRLRRYTALIDAGEGRSQEAKELRRTLELALPGDAALQRADLELLRRDLFQRLQA
jgi:predicted ATP-binding protein involved in virulence